MDEHAMTNGVVPVKSLMPGVVKLPRRYEKAAMGDPKTCRYRKVSLCGGPLHMRQGIADRLDDLMNAIMWVKQELILLRQHDILLKRQFFDINDSIQSLQPKSSSSLSLSSSTSSLSQLASSLNINGGSGDGAEQHAGLKERLSSSKLFSSPSSMSSTSSSLTVSSSTPSSPYVQARARTTSSGCSKATTPSSPIILGVFVRPAASATLLNGDCDTDSDGDDTFDDHFFRPRTSSMKTSRDLAALARRRGSKELV